MVIIYPHNQRFFLRRAHDILVMRTCHALAQKGHDVYLIMGQTSSDTNKLTQYYGLEPHPRLHFLQIPILRRETWPRASWHGVFNFFCFRRLKQLFSTLNPDLIYLSEIKFGKALFKEFTNLPIPVVYEIHGITGKNYMEPRDLEAEVFRRSNALITTTESLQKVICRLYPEAAPIFRVPLATDILDVCDFQRPEPGEPWRLCYVGQLYPLQGTDLLIRAVASLNESVYLDVYGGKQEHIDELKRLAKVLGAEKRIAFHGFVTPHEVLQQAAKAHICVIPCRSEKKMSFVAHTKLYEYFSMGRAIVASDLPSIREEVVPEVNALLFEPGNAEALAGAVRRLIATPELAENLAWQARLSARKFTWERRAEGLSRVFASVCGKK